MVGHAVVPSGRSHISIFIFMNKFTEHQQNIAASSLLLLLLYISDIQANIYEWPREKRRLLWV